MLDDVYSIFMINMTLLFLQLQILARVNQTAKPASNQPLPL